MNTIGKVCYKSPACNKYTCYVWLLRLREPVSSYRKERQKAVKNTSDNAILFSDVFVSYVMTPFQLQRLCNVE